jgi:pyruvate dehydrogenase E2 component (dihydrolipoamide acetyltransferase)
MGDFLMPSLGADMETGTLVEWLKHPGDPVKRGDVVAVVETDKGAIEIEIFEEGVIDRLLVELGARVPVGTPLARVKGGAETAAVERVPRVPPIALAAPKPEILHPATRPRRPSTARQRVSPAARRASQRKGIDVSSIRGSGPGGAVISRDVEDAARQASKPQRGLDLAAMRRAIAAAMGRSKREIPHYYLSHTFELSRPLEWLEAANASRLPADRLLLQVLLLKAVALALRGHPQLNGFYTESGFSPSASIHVGTAIAIRGGGLIAPAIHDVDSITLDQLMGFLRDLVTRARVGMLRSSELTDATITVSSLGERGVDALFGVIYPPQVALIGFGTVCRRPWAIGSRIESRPLITASLAADHRVSDGHAGAKFLTDIAVLLQSPEKL